MERYNLYLSLKKAGFPQGGSGNYIQDPDSSEKVYVPTSGEIYSMFLADPDGWQSMTDCLAQVWIDNSKK